MVIFVNRLIEYHFIFLLIIIILTKEVQILNTKKDNICLILISIFHLSIFIFILSNTINNSNISQESCTKTPLNNAENYISDKNTNNNESFNSSIYPDDTNHTNVTNNITSTDDAKSTTDDNIKTTSTPGLPIELKFITLNSYISNLSCSTFTISPGETINTILKKFESTCNYQSSLNQLKLINPTIDLNNIEIGTLINIPIESFNAGNLFKVKSNDTWYSIAKSNYSNYNTNNVIDFLISINNLPNNDLPLGENIFLPNL